MFKKLVNKIYIIILSHIIYINYISKKRNEIYSKLKHIFKSVIVLSFKLSAYALAKLLYIIKQEVD
jgi:hypothetical protein